MANNPGSASLGSIVQTTPVNTGAYLYQGLASAGASVGDALKTMAGMKMARDAASDTLDAMHANGTLSDTDYQAVVGKSVGAQQNMIGQYASITAANLAAQRQAGLQTNEGQVQATVGASNAAAQGGQERATQEANVANAIKLFQSTKLMPPQAPTPATPQASPAPQPAGQRQFQSKSANGQYFSYTKDGQGNMVGSPTPVGLNPLPNVPVE
jgi:hypothetical protein